ncbi:MAG: DUF975 family protein [Chitinispirillales bacterium]|jgi:uncharacterized membrane protein|nr:DUF975 family protein [Chitinispirillales bacterium]
MGYKSVRSNKKLRAAARSQLRGVWGKMFIAAFIMTTLIALPGAFLSAFLPSYSLPVESENGAWNELLMSFVEKNLLGADLEAESDSARLAAFKSQLDQAGLEHPELDRFFSNLVDSSTSTALDSRGIDSLLAEFFADSADLPALTAGFDMRMIKSMMGLDGMSIGDILMTVIPQHLPMVGIIIIIVIIVMLLALLIVSMVNGPFQLGFSSICLNRVEGEKIAMLGVFGGFRNFSSACMLFFRTVSLIISWSMLPLIPLVAGAVVLHQNMLHVILWAALWGLISIVLGITKAVSYSIAFFIMRDSPTIKPLKALKTSRFMMKGHKWKFTRLMLSFVGWFLLALSPIILLTHVLPEFEAFTVGWLLFEALPIKAMCFFLMIPYLMLTVANFYDDLKVSSRSNASYVSRRNTSAMPAVQIQEADNFLAGSKFGS